MRLREGVVFEGIAGHVVQKPLMFQFVGDRAQFVGPFLADIAGEARAADGARTFVVAFHAIPVDFGRGFVHGAHPPGPDGGVCHALAIGAGGLLVAVEHARLLAQYGHSCAGAGQPDEITPAKPSFLLF